MTEIDAIIEALPLGACLYRQGRILAANTAFQKLTGFDTDRLLSHPDPLSLMLDAPEMARVTARRESRARGGEVPGTVEMQVRREDGTILPVHVRVAPFAPAGADVLLLLLEPAERARMSRLIRGFIDVAIASARELTEADVFRVVREKLRALGFHPTVLEVNGGRYRVLGDDSELGTLGREIRSRWPGWWKPDGISLDETAAEQGLLIEDLRGFMAKALHHPVSEAPISSMLATVRVQGEIRFIIACSAPALDAAQASALGLLAKQVGAALENVVRLEELRRRNRELAALNQVARASATLGAGGALQAAIDELVGAIQVGGAALFRREGRTLHLAAHVGFDETWAASARVVPADSSTPWGEAAATGQAVLFDLDRSDDSRISTPAEGVGNGIQQPPAHCIALPLRVGEEINGVLVAAREQPLQQDDLRLLATLAAQAAVSLQNAMLLQEMRRRVEELSLLLELGQEVMGALELQQVLDAGARVAARALRTSSAYILLPDDDKAALRVAAIEDAEKPAAVHQGMKMSLDRPTLSALAFHTRRPHTSAHSGSDERIDHEIAQLFNCRATLAVPLVVHDRALGVLALVERTSRTFSAQDVRLATHAAQLVAAALESAELYDHERRRAEEMEQLNDELARTQQELIARERLAALGELSASIAHEVRNPLGVIFNSVGTLKRLLKPAGDVDLLLGIIGEEADRLNRMVGDLLDYSRPLQPALQPVPLKPLIEEALESARKQTGTPADAVKQKVSVATGLPPLRADSRLLRQALVNLFLNALQAMPKGGELRVRADAATVAGQPAAQIVIRDTGPGVPPDARQRIFQPFFTTKATGTGLGLAVVKRIIEGHRGDIALGDGTPGAEFRLRIPLDG